MHAYIPTSTCGMPGKTFQARLAAALEALRVLAQKDPFPRGSDYWGSALTGGYPVPGVLFRKLVS